MTLTKTDLQQLKQSGAKAILAKLAELQAELNLTILKQKRNELKNLHQAKSIRKSIAQLKTYLTQLKKNK